MIILPRELSYENGKMDGRAEVLEAANNAYSDMVERYEEKIKELEETIKILENKLNFYIDRYYRSPIY